ncbi:nucleotidyl transferase AbiEii/AbiGii toxin family protein [Kitasatospora sp. NPDC048540]|uniref:nucleotidyl transferase AbiEii/AbiGii toxin family protein n=1 Tax=Kitasatospora sp. NPDC048540 TaxID=3155634 RepID=UPI003407B491
MDDIRTGLHRGTVPHSVPTAQRPGLALPLTLRPADDARATQAAVFDPALKQHPNAFRAADPSFTDPALSAAWYAARRRAMDLLLAAVADSPWAGHLVVRGSVVLRAWYGDATREPGDLDFVVVPREWRIEEDRTTDLLHGSATPVPASRWSFLAHRGRAERAEPGGSTPVAASGLRRPLRRQGTTSPGVGVPCGLNRDGQSVGSTSALSTMAEVRMAEA